MAASTSTSTEPRILLTGASGFIGGSVLTQLLNSSSPSLRSGPITCLVRGADRVTKLKEAYGARVNPVLYQGLDDLETATAVAAQHDVVISATLGIHTASVRALLEGLARRKRARPGSEPWLIHTSGTSNLASRPFADDAPAAGSGSGSCSSNGRTFDDAADDIYGYEVAREAAAAYPQRTTELGVVNAGLELGVRTIVIMAPTIFGVGSGLFNKHSIQIPALVAAALAHGRAVVFGDGEGVWDHVHVQDLAALYEILALRALDDNDDDDEAAAAREDLPRGKKGIVFAGAGRHSWNDVARGVARAAHAAGALPDTRVDRLGVAGAVRVLAAAFPLMAHEVIVDLGLASNVRTVATVARRLGWRPARGEEAWEQGFREEVDHALRERREKGR